MKRSRRFRTKIEKADDAADAVEMKVSLRIKGDARKAVEALAPDKFQSAVREGVSAAIAKAAAPASQSEPGSLATPRVFKRAIVSKAVEQRYLLGVVLEPDEVDTQGDTQSAEDIRKAAFQFMEAYRGGGDAGHLGLMHKQLADDKLYLLESYIQKSDEVIEGEAIKKDSWLIAMRVKDDELWEAVKKGDYNGLSIGGTAVKQPVD